MPNYPSGGDLTVRRAIIKLVLGIDETFRADLGGNDCQDHGAEEEEEYDAPHVVCVCKGRALVGKRFPEKKSKNFFEKRDELDRFRIFRNASNNRSAVSPIAFSSS